MEYLIVYSQLENENHQTHYFVSESRNAIKHLETLSAKTVWVYDKNGWWLSFADRDKNGKPYRPIMYRDGEPRKFYAQKFQDIKVENRNGKV